MIGGKNTGLESTVIFEFHLRQLTFSLKNRESEPFQLVCCVALSCLMCLKYVIMHTFF